MPTKKKTTRKRAPSKSANVRPQPLIAVRDVPSSTRWYSQLLGAERTSKSMRSDHAHVYDRLLCGGSLVLAAVKRVRALRATVLLKPHVNPAPGHREIWIQDPDGYVVVIASPDGEAR